MPSKELVTIETPADAIEAIRGNLLIQIEDPETVSKRIMESILESESVDDILGSNIAIHAKDIVGRAFTLSGVKFLKSRFDQGLPVFGVMDATFLDNGAVGSITSSSRNICAQAAALWKLNALPCDVVIQQAETQSASGFYPMWLEKA